MLPVTGTFPRNRYYTLKLPISVLFKLHTRQNSTRQVTILLILRSGPGAFPASSKCPPDGLRETKNTVLNYS